MHNSNNNFKWMFLVWHFNNLSSIRTRCCNKWNPKHIQNFIKNRLDFIQIQWHKRKWHFLWSCNFRMLIRIHEPFIFSIIFRENANAQTTSLSVCFKKAFHFSKKQTVALYPTRVFLLLDSTIITEVIYS